MLRGPGGPAASVPNFLPNSLHYTASLVAALTCLHISQQSLYFPHFCAFVQVSLFAWNVLPPLTGEIFLTF